MGYDGVMTRGQASALADLQFHWDAVYTIGYHEETGIWYAKWLGLGASETMNAQDASDLRQMIRQDYFDRTHQGSSVTECEVSERMST